MFREMRRKTQQIPEEEAVSILKNGKITFHGAMTGHKIEAMRKYDEVSFTVIDQDEIVAHDRTTAYKSVICFRRARELTDHDEKVRALRLVGYKYSGAFPDLVEEEIAEACECTCCVEILIEHMTGKEGKVLLEKRRKES